MTAKTCRINAQMSKTAKINIDHIATAIPNILKNRNTIILNRKVPESKILNKPLTGIIKESDIFEKRADQMTKRTKVIKPDFNSDKTYSSMVKKNAPL